MSYKVRIDPELIAMRTRFVKTFGMPIIELMDPKPGERILDVGCGFGAVCQQLDEMGCKTVGIDISKSVVDAARELGVDARLVNAESLTFNEEFDAAYSSSALHWMRHLDQVAEGIMRALKPGGRFVGELGGRGSIVNIITAIRQVMLKNGIEMESVSSWYFPSVSEFAGVLERAGFVIRSMALVDRPTVLPGDVRDWMKMFGRHYMDAWDPSEHDRFLDAIRDAAAPTMVNEQGEWVADYRRLRFMAVKPA